MKRFLFLSLLLLALPAQAALLSFDLCAAALRP